MVPNPSAPQWWWWCMVMVCVPTVPGAWYDTYTGNQIGDQRLDDLRRNGLLSWCAIEVANCSANEPRRSDYTCNNLHYPSRGAFMTPFHRLLRPIYATNGGPRTAKSGRELPNARALRVALTPDGRLASKKFTTLFTNLNVFVTADVTSVHDTVNYVAVTTTCCAPGGDMDPRCIPIQVASDDVHLRRSPVRCLNLTRGITYQRLGCVPTSLPGERINTAAPMLELSHVYGTSAARALSIRELKGGKLKAETLKGKEWPPGNNPLCINNARGETRCHEAGDAGVNSLVGINLSYIWVFRQHNAIAAALARVNPCWNDERLYAMARAINIAMMQHITYYDLMVNALGYEYLVKSQVIFPGHGHVDDYDHTLEPRVGLEYVVGMRWFHTLQEGKLNLYDRRGKVYGQVSTVDMTLRTGLLPLNNTLEGLTQGSFRQPCASNDYAVDPDMGERSLGRLQFASDVIAADIMKSRDLGLPPYNRYRRLCNLPVAKDFDDLYHWMPKMQVEALTLSYEDVDDIDLQAGILAELPMEGSVMGPTLACIITSQLLRWRRADRFWFENRQHPGAFTPEQLQQIRKMTMSKVICDHGDSVDAVQYNAFQLPGYGNEFVPCSEYPEIDYEAWRDYSCIVRYGNTQLYAFDQENKQQYKEDVSNNTQLYALREDFQELFEKLALKDKPTNHPWPDSTISLYDRRGKVYGQVSTVDMTLRTGLLPLNNTLEGLTQGSFRQPCASNDYAVDPDMGERSLGRLQFASDVIAADIMKSRDLGLPPYNRYRRLCNLPVAKDFDDLYHWMPKMQVEALTLSYEDVDDIDLQAGILAELPMEGSVMGPTLACIITSQLLRWRRADRFWFENRQHPGAFTPEQLQQIRKMTMSKVICDHGDSVDAVQYNAFQLPGYGNEFVPCSEYPEIDYEAWRDYSCIVRYGNTQLYAFDQENKQQYKEDVSNNTQLYALREDFQELFEKLALKDSRFNDPAWIQWNRNNPFYSNLSLNKLFNTPALNQLNQNGNRNPNLDQLNQNNAISNSNSNVDQLNQNNAIGNSNANVDQLNQNNAIGNSNANVDQLNQNNAIGNSNANVDQLNQNNAIGNSNTNLDQLNQNNAIGNSNTNLDQLNQNNAIGNSNTNLDQLNQNNAIGNSNTNLDQLNQNNAIGNSNTNLDQINQNNAIGDSNNNLNQLNQNNAIGNSNPNLNQLYQNNAKLNSYTAFIPNNDQFYGISYVNQLNQNNAILNNNPTLNQLNQNNALLNNNADINQLNQNNGQENNQAPNQNSDSPVLVQINQNNAILNRDSNINQINQNDAQVSNNPPIVQLNQNNAILNDNSAVNQLNLNNVLANTNPTSNQNTQPNSNPTLIQFNQNNALLNNNDNINQLNQNSAILNNDPTLNQLNQNNAIDNSNSNLNQLNQNTAQINNVPVLNQLNQNSAILNSNGDLNQLNQNNAFGNRNPNLNQLNQNNAIANNNLNLNQNNAQLYDISFVNQMNQNNALLNKNSAIDQSNRNNAIFNKNGVYALYPVNGQLYDISFVNQLSQTNANLNNNADINQLNQNNAILNNNPTLNQLNQNDAILNNNPTLNQLNQNNALLNNNADINQLNQNNALLNNNPTLNQLNQNNALLNNNADINQLNQNNALLNNNLNLNQLNQNNEQQSNEAPHVNVVETTSPALVQINQNSAILNRDTNTNQINQNNAQLSNNQPIVQLNQNNAVLNDNSTVNQIDQNNALEQNRTE